MKLDEKQQKGDHWALETTIVMRLAEKHSPKDRGKNKALESELKQIPGILNIMCKKYYNPISYKACITFLNNTSNGIYCHSYSKYNLYLFKCSF